MGLFNKDSTNKDKYTFIEFIKQAQYSQTSQQAIDSVYGEGYTKAMQAQQAQQQQYYQQQAQQLQANIYNPNILGSYKTLLTDYDSEKKHKEIYLFLQNILFKINSEDKFTDIKDIRINITTKDNEYGFSYLSPNGIPKAELEQINRFELMDFEED